MDYADILYIGDIKGIKVVNKSHNRQDNYKSNNSCKSNSGYKSNNSYKSNSGCYKD
jgi:hypothetical protein